MKSAEKLDIVSSLISDIHSEEKRKSNTAFTAGSVLPSKEDTRDSRQKAFDALAYILTGDETCAAVCFDNVNNQFIVASNRVKPQYAGETIVPKLAAYAVAPFSAEYKTLETSCGQAGRKAFNLDATRKIMTNHDWNLLYKKSTLTMDEKELAKFFQNLKDNKIDSSSIVETATRIMSAENKGFKEDSEIKNYASDILMPYINLKVLANSIIDGTFKEAEVKALQSKNFKYVEGSPNVHAEVKVKQTLDNLDKEQKRDRSILNLGVTKLACCPCSKVMERAELKVSGTHGGTYPSKNKRFL
jgi:hypothetical protein